MITSLRWMLWICVGFTLLLFVCYLYLVSQKAIDIYRKKRLHKRKEHLEPLVLNYLKEGNLARSLLHPTPDDLSVLKSLLPQYSNLMTSDEQQERIQRLAAAIFTEPFRKLMRARRYSTRMNTLYAIEELHLDTLRYEIKDRLAQPKLDPIEKYQLYRIVATLMPSELIDFLADPKAEALPNFIYRELLLKVSDEMFEQAMERMDSFPPALRLCVIDIIGNKRDFRYLTILDQLLDSEHLEERIRTLKAFARIGYAHNGQHLIERAQAEAWPERLMAVKAMGEISRDEFVPVLKNAMRDSSWWVRTASAQGLLRFSNGQELLREIAELDEDRFARDMAREWLEAK